MTLSDRLGIAHLSNNGKTNVAVLTDMWGYSFYETRAF